jgi:hypothetical protein
MPAAPLQQSTNPVRRFIRRIITGIVQDVPPDIALCEYDCRKEGCTHQEWEDCDRRITRGAGEFMPPK